jgi:amino-acid N-acetyltransferase
VVEEDAGKPHVALVKLVNPELLDEWILQGIGPTLAQLSRLSISPYVVVDTDTTVGTVGHVWQQKLIDQAERVVAAVDSNSGPCLARVDNILRTSGPGSSPQVHFRKFLLNTPSA